MKERMTRQIFLDTETTGLSAQSGHRVVELAAVEAVDGKLTGRTFHVYLDPERSIDPRAEQVHGLSAEFLRGKSRFIDIATPFVDFVRGAECLIHNAVFDTPFINAELERAGSENRLQNLAKISCTMLLAKSMFPGESVSLDSLIKRAGIPTTRKLHSALEDANLLADVYYTTLLPPTKRQPREVKSTRMNTAVPVRSISPNSLGMEKVIELVSARQETFFYRQKHKRIIDHHVVNARRWKTISGPLVYAVTDYSGIIRYVGKWESESALYSRWIRHDTIHHQESARNFYLDELDAGRGPLAVWSISVQELWAKLPMELKKLTKKDISIGLEALWIQRWKSQLTWNRRDEPVPVIFQEAAEGLCEFSGISSS